MSRRRRAEKIAVVGDYKYNSVLATKFINCVMLCGKRRLAEKIFYTALDYAAEKTGLDQMSAFKKALDNVRPVLEVKSRRVGGANYQVPMEVDGVRGNALAIRWIIESALKRNEHSMVDRLGAELVQASNGEGGAVKKKTEVHKMAEANKAFAHYRW
ncbi:MAG: 30S ribosomal protein S7 [Chitinispirillales bacterium]|jgi:small subunit ribosomal protein S7|nr:30S ribosomal protein S7 [Chitinispirillales bacterium]